VILGGGSPADRGGVTFALRHPISSGVVFSALLATAFVFTFARPQFHPAIEVENINLGREPHSSVADVRAAFAAEGISFDHTSGGPDVTTTWLGVGPPPWADASLYVIVFPEKGVLGLGHGDWEDAVFERRVGNVLVHYGGADEFTLGRVKAALLSLEPAPHWASRAKF
jgi:hypothetical protein